MKRIVRFFLIVSFALITNASIGQGLLCGTPEDNRNEIEYQTKKKLLAKTSGIGTKSAVSPITVNVVFHIINNSVTPSHTSSMLSNLNNSFQGHNINFVKLCDNFTQSNNEDLPLRDQYIYL